MNSKRRTLGLSLGSLLVVFAIWLIWNRGTDITTTQEPAAVRSETETAQKSEMPAVESPEAAQTAGPDAEKPAGVDFSGRWQLDTTASESLDAILSAMGLSFVERSLVNNTVVTHIIAQTMDEFTIEVQSNIFSRTDHLPLDGRPAETVDPGGRPVESTTAWSDDGQQLITKVWVKKEDQHFTLTRSLNDQQDGMEVFVEFSPKSGPTLTSRRVYRRIQ